MIKGYNRSRLAATYFFVRKTDEQKKNLILVGFILLLLIHAIFIIVGFYKNDDLNYARYAATVAKYGHLVTPATSHFQLRWTVIFVTALFYKLFAINAFTSTLCSFISICLCGLMLKKITKSYKPFIFFLTLSFFFLAHSILFYMHRILPDPIICMVTLWMYLSYRSYSLNQRRTFGYALEFSLAFILAIITKETIIIVFPLFGLLFASDLVKKRRFRFWLYTVLISLFFVSAYLTYFKLSTGSFFFRYELLQSANYYTICSFDNLPFSYTLKRIGYELWNAMLLNGDLILILPGIASLFYQKKIRECLPVNTIDFTAFLVLLLASNFMTISITSYVPLCHDPRHFLFLFPFAAILSGPLLYLYGRDPEKFLLLPLFLFVATIVMFYLNAGTTKYLYLLFSFLLLLPFVCKFSSLLPRIYSNIFFAGLMFMLFINYCIDIIKPRFPYYRSQERIVNRIFKGRQDATIVSLDEYSHETTEFFLNFETGNLKILPIGHAFTAKSDNIYLLKVGDLNPELEFKLNQLFKENTDTSIYQVDNEGDVNLYKVNKDFLMKLITD